MARPSLLQINLDPDDEACVDRTVGTLANSAGAIENPQFLQEIALSAQTLPRRLREGVLRFKLEESWPVCLVSGFTVDNAAIGKTPRDSMDQSAKARTRREDIYLMLCCHLLGEAIAFATEHEGHLIHEVLPIANNEGRQRGNSTDALHWHTEHAFHPERMDYLALLCLRNNDRVATTFAYAENIQLDDRTKDALARPAVPLKPDDGNRPTGRNRAEDELVREHPLRAERGLCAELTEQSYARIQQTLDDPPLVPVLFGGPSRPYIRIHPYYVGTFHDAETEDAFKSAKGAIEDALEEVVLTPGQLLIIDNYRAIHGRRAIPGHFDGTDRWLKRAFVVRDLRKTRHMRLSAPDRVIY